ncbi:putative nuclease HARBI1 [Rhizophagus clarus]|uniref:Putative nuclease HARBI1 n=1 Tax=Rhizophagus clarus TaxID=94130 RepID=A0A8H3QXQ0_9GLOM|nr:putative nuclease HARBI1 [Rhizophagus clarus]
MSYQKDLENLLMINFIKSSQIFEDSDNESNDSKEQFEVEESKLISLELCSLLDSCYLEPYKYNIAKSQEWWYLILPKYDDIGFKKIMRMDSQSFQYLATKIGTHSIFQSTGNKQQAPVELQLAIFLRKVSSKDEIFGELRKKVYIGFSNIGEFNNIIGAINGTHIILETAPLKQSEIYWNRKKKYSIQYQGIVDHNGIFIDYEIRWLGSVHDAKVYQNSYFYQNYRTLIKGWDYLLRDSAYPLSSFLIKPFNNPVTDLQTHFNVTHSLHCVVIENAFGKLKNRFSCLKGLFVKKISTVVNLTEYCIILHNFLETNNDS